jgi:hypothetical protein
MHRLMKPLVPGIQILFTTGCAVGERLSDEGLSHPMRQGWHTGV